MKVLITGARGMLGSELVRVLGEENEVNGVCTDDFDICNLAATRDHVSRLRPDIVIHAAAFTDVDGCERQPELAFRINTMGTQNVALVCQAGDIPLLYVSTDYVFGGDKKSPYKEWDAPKPVNVYGESKYAGERVIAHLLRRYYIVRISWLYGAGGKNFVNTILGLTEETNKLQVVDDQVGSPTYSVDVALGVRKLIAGERFGIYHMANRGECSWYELARKIVELSGKEASVEPIKSGQSNRSARRPSYSALRNLALEISVGDPMRPWEEALHDYLSK